MRALRVLICGWVLGGVVAGAQGNPAKAEKTAALKAKLAATPVLALVGSDLPMVLPDGVGLGMVSWMAYDAKAHVTWVLQRGDKIDPVLAFDAQGKIIHSFGKGMFTIPHAIRLDPAGNVWTVDAGSSKVMKFSPEGKLLLTIDVGGMPERKNGFAGTTDIGFEPNGHVLITDGYGNARVLEYAADGTKVKEWGVAGVGPGEFHLPHSIAISKDMIYVADRENGRIERFTLEGKYLDEFETDGRTYSIRLGKDGALWAGINPLDAPTSDPGWLVKMDAKTGKFLGYVAVEEKTCLHSVDVDGEGFPMTDVGSRVVRFRSESTPDGVTRASPAERQQAKNGAGGWKLELGPPEKAVKYGDAAILPITSTNLSAHDHTFELGPGPWMYQFGFEVLDNNGKPVKFKFPEDKGDDDCSPCMVFSLHPGDRWAARDFIPFWYSKAMTPGTYLIRVFLYDGVDKTTNWSNRITVRVLPS